MEVPRAAAAAGTVSEEARSIVTQAASILDEEMAKGVLAARRSSYGGTSVSPAANPMVRQVHDLIDNVAAAWPGLPGLPAGLRGARLAGRGPGAPAPGRAPPEPAG